MNGQDKLFCAAYAVIAIIALPATWINNVAFMTQSNNNSIIDFVHAAYVNAAAASLSNDLFLVAAAVCLFMIAEARRLGIRFVWLYIGLSALVAISVTFPVFLLVRQVKIAKERAEPIASSTSPTPL